MPLLDHFRLPVSRRVPWESFHSNWATRIADGIADRLPRGYSVIEYTHSGTKAEIDIATYDDALAGPAPGAGGVATAVWSPPVAAGAFPSVRPRGFEVRVYSREGGLQLVGVVELVSPANKKGVEPRRAFTAKCMSLLYQGVSVVVIDVVTTRRANLHNLLARRMTMPADLWLPPDARLYATAYRPVERRRRVEIEVWKSAFAVGDPLPTMPLRLTGDLFVPVDFEAAYMEACRKRKLLP